MIKQLTKPTSAELNRISNIWLTSNIEAHDFIPRSYWEKNYPMVLQQLAEADIITAYDNDKIVGFMGLDKNYIEGIFVESNHLHQGFGKSLIEHAKTTHSVLNLSVYGKNQSAIEFYLAQGFTKSSDGIDSNTGEPEIQMVWQKNQFNE